MNQTYDMMEDNYNGADPLNVSTNYTASEIFNTEIEQDDLPTAVVFILIIVGVIGNTLVCLAILLDRRLQNLTNYFLLSLAITDLLLNLLILPSRMATIRYKMQPSMFPLCFLCLIGDDYINSASAIHICFISFGRYFAIKDPMSQRNLTKTRVALKIGLVWLISLITVIPYMAAVIISKHPDKPEYCSNLLSNFRFFDTILLIEAMVIVVMIIVVVVSFIMTTILLRNIAKRQHENQLKGGIDLIRTVGGKKLDSTKMNNISVELQSEKKALRVVWLVSFAFIISMGPYASASLFYLAFPRIKIPKLFMSIVSYLAYANSIINPFIYTIFNRKFRTNFKNLLLFKYKKIA